MKALVQRVTRASVAVNGSDVASIGTGLLVLVGVHRKDTEQQARRLAAKIAGLRIFPDAAGKMNLNVGESGGALLVVSQFTLYADTRKGNRPSYSDAARPEGARRLYEIFVEFCRQGGLPVATGVFQADMKVELVNDGPITLFCESEPV